MNRVLRRFIGAWSVGGLLFATAAEAQRPCDPSLTPESDPVIQYRQRGDDLRCEGFYRSNVNSGGNLALVGLLQRPLRFAPDDRVLQITAPGQAGKVLVRGQGIPIKLYYRLDAELASGTSVQWPIGLLQNQGVGPERVGFYGRLAEQPDWYVPLDIMGKQPSVERPLLLLRASVDTDEFWWRYAEAPEGRCGKMTDWQRIEKETGFAAGEAIPLELPKGMQRRICVEAAVVTRRDGGFLSRLIKIRR